MQVGSKRPGLEVGPYSTCLPALNADGGKWKAEAIEAIGDYFKAADLPSNITVLA